MAGSVKVNGVWKTTSNYYTKVNGVWKNVTNGYVKVNGVWKQFLTPAPSYYGGPIVSYYTPPQYYDGGGGTTYYTVPNVVGLTVSQATNSISGSGNTVGSTSSTSTTNAALDGTVASQSPSSGLYVGQQNVSFTYYAYAGGGTPVCGSGGSNTTTEFYCQGPQRWSRPVTVYYDSNGSVCSTSYGTGSQEVSCAPSCGCGSAYTYCPSLGYSVPTSGYPDNCPGAQPSYYAAPIYYSPPVVTYYAAPIYYTAPTYYAAPIYYTAPTYYAAPIYYSPNTSVTYYAAPVYYSPNTSVTYYAAPAYYRAPTYYAAPIYYSPNTSVTYYGGGGGCWVYGTRVTLSNGLTKPIENVVVGDVLKAPIIPTYPNGEDISQWYPASKWSIENIQNLEYEDTIVTNVRHTIESAFYHINEQFKVTGDHYVFVKKGLTWQFAQVDELEVGDYFKNGSNEEILITKKVKVNDATMVVDIDVEDNDLFLADGIITHNIKAI
jgi:hypothetical protein